MRQICEDVSSSAKSKKLPVKWMAPESLYQGLYTTKSDVYVQKIPTLLNIFRYIAAQKTSATLKIVISEFNLNLSRIPVVNIVGNFVLVSAILTQDYIKFSQSIARAASVEFLNQRVCKDHVEAFLCQEKFTNMRQTRHLNWY